MSAHVLSVIERVKGERVNDLTSLAMLTYYKAGVDLAQWGYQLDLRDLSYIESCQSWEELVETFTKMEKKYTELWELAGCPGEAEDWNKLARPGKVGHQYWDALNREVDYGRPIGVMQ